MLIKQPKAKTTDENICTFSVFSGQIASSVRFPFKACLYKSHWTLWGGGGGSGGCIVCVKIRIPSAEIDWVSKWCLVHYGGGVGWVGGGYGSSGPVPCWHNPWSMRLCWESISQLLKCAVGQNVALPAWPAARNSSVLASAQILSSLSLITPPNPQPPPPPPPPSRILFRHRVTCIMHMHEQ